MSTTSQNASCPALKGIGAKCHEYRGHGDYIPNFVGFLLGRGKVTMTEL